ncbi:hypothetical protein FG877_02210 [Enterococcus casseliflavus]|nr:hypothetical protein [Enterococcus casseliflavus]
MDLLENYSYNYENLVENCSNKRISKTYIKKFCRFYYDIVKLVLNDKSILYDNHDEDGNFKDNQTILKNYSGLKFRYYYFFLFHFIYSNFELEDIENIGNDLSEEFEDLDLIEESWEINYVAVATIRGFVLAFKEYQHFLSNKKLSVKRYLNAELIEEQCHILKQDVEGKDFQYLTYFMNVGLKKDPKTNKKKKISHSKRLRNVQKNTLSLYEFQKEQQELRDMAMISVMKKYYDLKRKDKKLTIDKFIDGNNTISKRTFFNYKKIYDKKYLGKSKIEKAYQAYEIELEKDSNFKITTDFVSQFKVSQEQLKQHIDEMNAHDGADGKE